MSDAQPTLLIVDDTRENLEILGGLLQPHYRVRVANSGARALAIVSTSPHPDLILLDIMMPVMDGFEVLSHLKINPETAHIPVIFVTAMDGDADEERGLSLGAVDYVSKPIHPATLLARVRTHIELKRARDRLAEHNHTLEKEVEKRTREVNIIKDVSLYALTMLAEKRDNETGNHLRRTRAYVETLMQELQDHPKFAAALTPRQQRLIANAAPLHDIGKVGIPDQILLKPGRLTVEEFEIMKTHAQIGAETIDEAIRRVLSEDPNAEGSDEAAMAFLHVAREIALSHHERWDGAGYPQGLAGEEIPLSARLMAIADVFDALICKRHYKAAFPLDDAEKIILAGRSSHFDPDLVDAFMRRKDDFIAISRRYADPENLVES